MSYEEVLANIQDSEEQERMQVVKEEKRRMVNIERENY
jgi:hypothetical protein